MNIGELVGAVLEGAKVVSPSHPGLAVALVVALVFGAVSYVLSRSRSASIFAAVFAFIAALWLISISPVKPAEEKPGNPRVSQTINGEKSQNVNQKIVGNNGININNAGSGTVEVSPRTPLHEPRGNRYASVHHDKRGMVYEFGVKFQTIRNCAVEIRTSLSPEAFLEAARTPHCAPPHAPQMLNFPKSGGPGFVKYTDIPAISKNDPFCVRVKGSRPLADCSISCVEENPTTVTENLCHRP